MKAIVTEGRSLSLTYSAVHPSGCVCNRSYSWTKATFKRGYSPFTWEEAPSINVMVCPTHITGPIIPWDVLCRCDAVRLAKLLALSYHWERNGVALDTSVSRRRALHGRPALPPWEKTTAKCGVLDIPGKASWEVFVCTSKLFVSTRQTCSSVHVVSLCLVSPNVSPQWRQSPLASRSTRNHNWNIFSPAGSTRPAVQPCSNGKPSIFVQMYRYYSMMTHDD